MKIHEIFKETEKYDSYTGGEKAGNLKCIEKSPDVNVAKRL